MKIPSLSTHEDALKPKDMGAVFTDHFLYVRGKVSAWKNAFYNAIK